MVYAVCFKEGGIEIVKLIYDLLRKLKADKTGKLLRMFKLLLRDEVAEKPKPSDQIIRVDRSVRPVYPDGVKEVLYPKFESTGPAEYDMTKLERWLHPDQEEGVVVGDRIHEYLKDNDLLKYCLSLRDLEEIQKKGIIFFRQNFKGKEVFAWKSVVRTRSGGLDVPFLYRVGDGVVLDWCWLGHIWNALSPALRFPED